jgi:hypothetical protein
MRGRNIDHDIKEERLVSWMILIYSRFSFTANPSPFTRFSGAVSWLLSVNGGGGICTTFQIGKHHAQHRLCLSRDRHEFSHMAAASSPAYFTRVFRHQFTLFCFYFTAKQAPQC